jgi:single-strand DNA-binding protein
VFENYVRKGKELYIEGKLKTRSWDDPQGQKRHKTEVTVLNMQMFSDQQGQSQGGQGGGYSAAQQQVSHNTTPKGDSKQTNFGDLPADDDLPF